MPGTEPPPQDVPLLPEETQWIHFAEQRGRLAELWALARRWAEQPGYAGAEVLRSPGQADEAGELYVLLTRWRGAVPDLELPAGTKGWAFVAVETPEKP